MKRKRKGRLKKVRKCEWVRGRRNWKREEKEDGREKEEVGKIGSGDGKWRQEKEG